MKQIISREEARAAGLRFYFTGKPCNKGMIAPRRVSSKCCTCDAHSQQERELSTEWTKANRERFRDRQRKRREGTSRSAESAAYRAKYPEKVALAKRRSVEKKPHLYRALLAKRKAAKRAAYSVWATDETEFVMLEAADLARLREAATGIAWHVDHMVPLQAREACGLHCADNLQVIPAVVNISKHNRMLFTAPGEWLGAI